MKFKRIPAGTPVNPADFTRTLRRVMVPVSFDIADVLVPAAWADLHTKIHNDDELIVWREDRAWRVHLLVVEKGIGYVKTTVLHRYEAEAAKAEADAEDLTVPDNYIVNHAPKTGWRVLTKEPHLEVSRDHKSRREATLAAIAHHQRSSMAA